MDGKRLSVERKDVWDVVWADDNEEMLCCMEKTKMILIRGEVAEAPVISSGYLARFKGLEVIILLYQCCCYLMCGR